MPLHRVIETFKKNRTVLALITVLFALPGYAQITPSDDAYVNSASPTTNYGGAGTLNRERLSPSESPAPGRGLL